jgi:very-short-patch-repair endonuclease
LIYEDTEPINVTKKNLYYIINNFYKKEETYIISKIYLHFYNKYSYNKNCCNKINLKYQFKIQFTSYIIDLLIGNNICIEIDENKHNNYNKEYEIDRNKLLSLLGYKVIHINPNIFYLNEKLILNFIDEIVSYYNNKINEVNKDDNIINYLNYVNNKKKQNIIKFNEYKYNSDHIWLY